jgi:hypothetical protein
MPAVVELTARGRGARSLKASEFAHLVWIFDFLSSLPLCPRNLPAFEHILSGYKYIKKPGYIAQRNY